MFYRLPHPWDPQYAIPDYIKAEPPGRGVHYTKYMPRKTIQSLIPQYLGADPDIPDPGSKNDSITAFGQEVAGYVMSTIKNVPPHMRRQAMKALFNQLDPTLWDRVAKKAAQFQKRRDYGAKKALQAAIATSVSAGFAKELVKLGRTKRMPPMNSMLGLGLYGEAAQQVVLEGFWSTMKDVVSAPLTGTKWVAGKGWSAAKQGSSWAKDAASKIGSVACRLVQTSAGKVGAAAGSAAMGAPPEVGMIGAQVAGELCGGNQVGPPGAPLPAAPSAFPIVPVAIGGAALLGVLLLTR